MEYSWTFMKGKSRLIIILLIIVILFLITYNVSMIQPLVSASSQKTFEKPLARHSVPWVTSVAKYRSEETWCKQNPYLRMWSGDSFLAAASAAIDFRGNENKKGLEESWRAGGWGRFDAAPIAIDSGAGLKRYPPTGHNDIDGGKWLYNLDILRPGCVIYSVGSNAQFEFEYEMIEKTPCEVFTFDCTVDKGRISPEFEKRGRGRLSFHPLCVSDGDTKKENFASLRELAASFNHTRIDLLKLDVEGFEYRIFEGLFRDALRSVDTLDFLPMQLSFELHTCSILVPNAAGLSNMPPPPMPQRWWDVCGLSAGDMLVLWNEIVDLGFTVVSREDNPGYQGGSEFTVVRSFC